MLYYYGTQSEVQAACDKVYVNMLREVASNGDGTLYVDPVNNTQKITSSLASDEDLVSIPILGYRKGVLQKSTGFTTCWDEPRQCAHDATKYYAAVPEDVNLRAGVTASMQEFNQEWLPEASVI